MVEQQVRGSSGRGTSSAPRAGFRLAGAVGARLETEAPTATGAFAAARPEQVHLKLEPCTSKPSYAMLSGQFAQPPRRFEPRHLASAKTACGRCTADVFNEALRRSLGAAAKDQSSLSWHYACTASDVYTSMLAGCRWCTSIGNAVLTSADLRYWTNRWLGSVSDGDSLMSIDTDEADGAGEQSAAAEDDASYKSESSDKETPGFLTINALDCSARLDVTVEFLKWGDSPVFNLMDAAVEVTETTEEEDGVFSGMTGEEAVHVRFEVISPGKLQWASGCPWPPC